MIMRCDEQSSFPEKQAIFFALRILSRTFPARAQRYILLHHEASKKRTALFPFQVLGNSLEVLPARAFWDEAGFMPEVLCGLDVVFDDEGAIAHPRDRLQARNGSGVSVQTALGEKSRILG